MKKQNLSKVLEGLSKEIQYRLCPSKVVKMNCYGI